jgi:restriction endonuclease S subunit
MAFNQSCYGLRSKTPISNDYIYYVLKREIQQLKSQAFGSKFDAITIKTFEEVKLPIPPLDIQQQIVSECEAVDAEVAAAQGNITAVRNSIYQTLHGVSNSNLQPFKQVAHKVSDNIDPQSKSGRAFYIGLENIESGSGQLVGQTDTPYQDIKSTKISFQAGNVLYGKLRPNLNKVYLAQQEGICSTDILAFRFQSPDHAHFYAAYLLSDTFNSEVLKGVSGQQLPRTSWGKMQTIKVPVLSEEALSNIVSEIKSLEKNIAAAQSTIAAAPVCKQAIMQRYL